MMHFAKHFSLTVCGCGRERRVSLGVQVEGRRDERERGKQVEDEIGHSHREELLGVSVGELRLHLLFHQLRVLAVHFFPRASDRCPRDVQ